MSPGQAATTPKPITLFFSLTALCEEKKVMLFFSPSPVRKRVLFFSLLPLSHTHTARTELKLSPAGAPSPSHDPKHNL